MGLAEVKNDLKTLFLILNTLFGLISGLYAISNGIAIEVSIEVENKSSVTFVDVVVGILVIVVAVLGYCGAIKENKNMLYIYSGAMALEVVGDIVGFMLVGTKNSMTTLMTPLMTMAIMDVCGTVLTLVLAVILARTLGRRSVDQGYVLCPTPTPYTPNI